MAIWTDIIPGSPLVLLVIPVLKMPNPGKGLPGPARPHSVFHTRPIQIKFRERFLLDDSGGRREIKTMHGLVGGLTKKAAFRKTGYSLGERLAL